MDFGMTDGEKDLLDLLAQGKNLTQASQKLGIDKSTASKRLRHVRRRYDRAADFLWIIDEYRKLMPHRHL